MKKASKIIFFKIVFTGYKVKVEELRDRRRLTTTTTATQQQFKQGF